MSATFTRGALVALCTALLAGLLAALYTLPAGAAVMEPLGLDMRALRPLHTVFGAAWLALAAVAVLARVLRDHSALRLVVASFAFAGIGILVTLPLGHWSGREYVGFHPGWAIPIALGWLALCIWALRQLLPAIWRQPVHVLMWVSGLGLFAFTFAEQYAWLLPQVLEDPIVDRRIQLKSCGTLIGSLNFLVYGCLVWLGAQLGDRDYGHSRTARALWFLAVLNNFVNYVHHTYHLPQGHGLKWIGFLVSMTEIVVLLKALSDLTKLHTDGGACRTLLAAAKGWTVFVLASSMLLALPPLNSLVHGTYLVPGHAMAGMVGMDTMAMLAVVAWLLGQPMGGARRWIVMTNAALATMTIWLHAAGIVDGITRFLHPGPGFTHRPAWLAASLAPVLAVTGGAVFLGFAGLLPHFLRLAFARRRLCDDPLDEETALAPTESRGTRSRSQ